MEMIIQGFAVLANVKMILILFFGSALGIIIGALPGLGPTSIGALLLPFTLSMQPIEAIILLAAIYCSSMYGGSISAILVNTPGTPAAAATTFDGFPLAQKGEAGRALGMANFSSFIGGVFSLFVFVLAAPALAKLAFKFGPPEYFALTIFSLSMLASISKGSPVKNLLGGAIGVFLSIIGLDYTTGAERFTFGIPSLIEGINFIPVMIGLFTISELLRQSTKLRDENIIIASKAMKLPSLADFKRVWKTILVSSGIGTFIGILPAEGGAVASLIAYNEAKRWSENKDEFGEGSIEGIAASESANNAATGGAMVPTLALGIPGSSTTAIILAGLIIHGIRPGPYLFQEQPTFLYAIFAGMLVANILFFALGMLGAKLFSKITLIPKSILWPAVLMLSTMGSYAINQNIVDVIIMILAGVIGFFLSRWGIVPAPIVIGLVLGGSAEIALKQSMIIFEGNGLLFFTKPIAMAFFVLTFFVLFGRKVFQKLPFIKLK